MRPEVRRFFARLDRGAVEVDPALLAGFPGPGGPFERLGRLWGLSPLAAGLRLAGETPDAEPPAGAEDDDLDFDHPALRARALGPGEARDRRIGRVPGPGAGRVAVTVVDIEGRAVGRTLRRIDPGGRGPKWLLSPGFPTGRHLFNLDRAWPSARRLRAATVVEGPFDALHLARLGWPNAVALLGNRLTGWHVDLLLTVGVETLNLMLDNDHGGRQGTRWAMAGDGRLDQFRVVDLRPSLPRGMDPDRLGPPELAALLGPPSAEDSGPAVQDSVAGGEPLGAEQGAPGR